MNQRILVFLALVISISACHTTSVVKNNTSNKKIKSVDAFFHSSELLNGHHVGFTLYDLDLNKTIVEKNAADLFTPASNIKLLSLYALLDNMPDSIPWMRVYEQDGFKYYEPAGDPTFMHFDLETPERIANYFSTAHNKGDTINLSISHFRSEPFGKGWMWDDYRDYYQAELSPFPIHGNVIKIDSVDLKYKPSWLEAEILYDNNQSRSVLRPLDENVFTLKEKNKNYTIPFHVDSNTLRNYFSEQGLILQYADVWDLGPEAEFKTIYSHLADKVYQYMMDLSDNHMAEQMFMQIALEKYNVLSTNISIQNMLADDFPEWKENIKWIDASGISRYNLLSPNFIVALLNKMQLQFGMERIIKLLDKKSGWDHLSRLKGKLFAKSGSMSYCQNLSGFIKTNNNKWYAFSFLNNNFVGPGKEVKEEMDQLLNVIIENY